VGNIAGSSDLAKLMSNINQLIYAATPSNRYATFFLRTIRAGHAPGSFYVNGGHNRPWCFEMASPTAGRWRPSGGLLSGSVFTRQRGAEGPATVMVLFTDGISEAMMRRMKSGRRSPHRCIRLCRDRPALEMIDVLIRGCGRVSSPERRNMTI